MKHWLKRAFGLICLAAAVVITCSAWFVIREDRKIRAEADAIKKAAMMPFVVRGFELDMLPYISPVGHTSYPTGDESDDVLILVGRDSCPVCKKQMPWWKRTLEVVPHDRKLEVWLVSLDAGNGFSDLIEYLDATHRAHRQFTVPSVDLFTLRTGVSAVPMTISTKAHRVTLVHTGMFRDADFERIKSALLAPVESAIFIRGIGEGLRRR